MIPVVLASSSKARAVMLRAAGIQCHAHPTHLEEEAIKRQCLAQELSVEDTALRLAADKSLMISVEEPESLVIGADQILECAGRRFDKPANVAAARQQLLDLKGKNHRLISAVSVAQAGEVLWSHVETARLRMRDFSDTFLDEYIESMGVELMESVGAYKIERMGAQLFEEIEGDHFTIMGMPLIPLMKFLRRANYITK